MEAKVENDDAEAAGLEDLVGGADGAFEAGVVRAAARRGERLTVLPVGSLAGGLGCLAVANAARVGFVDFAGIQALPLDLIGRGGGETERLIGEAWRAFHLVPAPLVFVDEHLLERGSQAMGLRARMRAAAAVLLWWRLYRDGRRSDHG